MRDELVVFVEYGGLGDHLFFSHLPRIAKELGCPRVLISNKSPYRSQDTRRLVWEMNPHVDGFTDKPGNYKAAFASVDRGTNVLDRIMTDLGFNDGLRMHEPELYYTPKRRADAAGLTILDPNFISYVGDVLPGSLARYLAEHNIHVDAQLAPREKSADQLRDIPTIATKDLFDYCDLIHSCGGFLCFTSGGATLAAALRKPARAFYGPGQNGLFHHSLLHTFVQLNPDGTALEKHAGDAPRLQLQGQS